MYINIFWTLCPLIIIFYLLDILNQRKSVNLNEVSKNEFQLVPKNEKELLETYEA